MSNDYSQVKGDDGMTDDERRQAKMREQVSYERTGENPGTEPNAEPFDYDNAKVDDLKAEIQRRNESRTGEGVEPLSQTGRRDELVARLKDDDGREPGQAYASPSTTTEAQGTDWTRGGVL